MREIEQYVHRQDTKIISLREATHYFSEPEGLRLQLSFKAKKKPLDIGSLAYCKVGRNSSIHDDRGTPVIISSLVAGRRELVRRLLGLFAGARDETVVQTFVRVQYFVSWLNSTGYSEIFEGELQAQEAYRDYTAYLNQRIFMQELKPRSANHYQEGAISLIELLYPESYHHILSGAIRIIAVRNSVVPCDSHVQLYKDVCMAIAQQCSAFVLGSKPYPCVVAIMDYEVVLFPSNVGAIGPFKKPVPLYNVAERRVATAEEYITNCAVLGIKNVKSKDVARAVKGALENFEGSNKNARHRHRICLAALAAKAYACLFVLITGASPSEFSQFTYKDALEVEKSPLKKELSAVKFRAGGKATLYNIGRNNGLGLLREYLKLREWILNGRASDKLFFSISELGTRIYKRDQGVGEFPVTHAMRSFYNSISGVFIDSSVPILTARAMRKHKSLVQHSARLSPSTVSKSLNHTEVVNALYYAEGTLEQQKKEFGLFWKSLRHAATIVRERSEKTPGDLLSTAAGHCGGFDQPEILSGTSIPLVELNCRTQYGCIYCQHYVCHSDEEDIHKLLSLQYVITAVRKVTSDSAHAEALFKELSIRIEFIIDALSKRSESVRQIVDMLKKNVFEYGMLTLFWEKRLVRYEMMGVVF
ncbi:hypothetical protein SB725_20480 [Pseudomonas sp. SIMBA_041]|uniref:hypothetical protein n=1 Tax=Pseudomonas sp. SIMBA_041 TaxID=3085782 RepID=UPI00397A8EC2